MYICICKSGRDGRTRISQQGLATLEGLNIHVQCICICTYMNCTCILAAISTRGGSECVGCSLLPQHSPIGTSTQLLPSYQEAQWYMKSTFIHIHTPACWVSVLRSCPELYRKPCTMGDHYGRGGGTGRRRRWEGGERKRRWGKGKETILYMAWLPLVPTSVRRGISRPPNRSKGAVGSSIYALHTCTRTWWSTCTCLPWDDNDRIRSDTCCSSQSAQM